MRPLSLEMTAFGSYAAKTVVPFEQMKHGLYLVTGDTGAGKTTIFDAIVFALFGTASGPDRKGDMLHCDYVPKSEDTVVTLRFLQSGKEFTVTRSLHFRKKRGTDEYGDSTVDAELHEPDCAPIKGASAVTRRVEALLGLNAEQFSRIIMLAQGEFKRFLKANSDEKNEILGKLFDNSAYLYYQNLILGARNELKRRRLSRVEEVSALMQTLFIAPPDLDEAAREGLLPEHPALLKNLTALTEQETLQSSEQRAAEERAYAQVTEINTRIGAAEAVNEKLDAIERDREKLQSLYAQDEEMERRGERLALADAAFHKVTPARERAGKSRADWNRSCETIRSLRETLSAHEQAVSDAQASVDADADAKAEQTRLLAELQSISDQLPKYARLDARRSDESAAAGAAEKARGELAAAQQKNDAILAGIRALNDRLDAAQQVDAQAETARTARSQAMSHRDAITGANGLITEVAAVKTQEEELNRAQASFQRATEAASAAQNAYNALYQRFIAAQAGILAQGLRDTLSASESAQCPVCGSVLCRDHLPQLAPLPDETPDKDAVDRAKREADRTERKRNEQFTDVQTRKTAIESGKRAVLQRAKTALPDCERWEQLASGEYLPAAAEEAERRADEAETALDAALKAQQARDADRETLREQQDALKVSNETIERLRADEKTQSEAQIAAAAEIRALRESLAFETEAEAASEQTRLQQRAGALAARIQAHETALADARQQRDTVSGALREQEAAAPALEAAMRESDAALGRILSETGFASTEAAEAALAPIGEQDGERWLQTERAALQEHAFQKQSLEQRLREQKAAAEGLQRADLAALETEKQQLQAQYEAARAAFAETENYLNNHRSVLEKVEAAKRELADTDAPWRRIERLAALAGGASSLQGKLSFDRYVMGAMFREILEMANRRMELMSGGRYELVHKAGADRRNAKAGLEIEVLDHNTGQQRPSGSLSGGESFFTSLSLALGLSDVVQNHAGGRQMDALFIDEGFGSLSDDVLDKALDVLNQLSEGSRLVGIISHVDRLGESIPQKIRVKTGEKGSTLKLETA